MQNLCRNLRTSMMFSPHTYLQMLAVLAMYGKIPARLKVRNLFDLFDLDLDDKLNSSETILMLRFVGDMRLCFRFRVGRGCWKVSLGR